MITAASKPKANSCPSGSVASDTPPSYTGPAPASSAPEASGSRAASHSMPKGNPTRLAFAGKQRAQHGRGLGLVSDGHAGRFQGREIMVIVVLS